MKMKGKKNCAYVLHMYYIYVIFNDKQARIKFTNELNAETKKENKKKA